MGRQPCFPSSMRMHHPSGEGFVGASPVKTFPGRAPAYRGHSHVRPLFSLVCILLAVVSRPQILTEARSKRERAPNAMLVRGRQWLVLLSVCSCLLQAAAIDGRCIG